MLNIDCCLTLIVAFSFIWALKKVIGGHAKLPPGPRGLPLVGYLPFLGHNLHHLFMELAGVYGPIYKLSLGNKLCVIINSPSLAREVVREHDTTFANRNPNRAALVFSYGGNDIAFSPYGPKWQFLRKILVRKMLSKANLDNFYALRRNVMLKMLKEVYRKSCEDVAINVGELAFVTVIDMISSMFWGGTLEEEKGNSVAVEFRTVASQLVDIMGKPNVSDFFPVIAKLDLQGIERKIKKVRREMDNIYNLVIERAREGLKQSARKDFLQFLLKYRDEDTGKSISVAEIKAMLMDIVVGGTDTTSTMVEWTMAELILHPEVMQKAQEELAEVVGLNNSVEESHVQRLPYLHAVAKETLRLHPAAPLLLPRCPTRSCTVGGYTIPEGTKVFLNVWAMHRDPEFWDNPSEFRPERFILNDANGKKLDFSGNNFEYLPFGSGRRICAGLVLGERMLMYVLASLLHSFEWKVAEGSEPDTTEKLGIVLEKARPLFAVPQLRLANLEAYGE
ncbi:hypothetical protein SLEP1_g9219 [Rubroshorea leprosula]|uniref:Cytochrome P450 n=1 Tax=Rubroshorea leprosula TaxID=152421 RepID=A0AAV5IA82_9ROSI|nr:hypothetical protein SLEP1_g9219 [Rubroshorea leprosula]